MNHLLRQSHKTPMGERQNCWTDRNFYTALLKIYPPVTADIAHKCKRKVRHKRSHSASRVQTKCRQSADKVQTKCRQSADKVQTECRQSADKYTLSNLLIISAVHTKSAKCKQNKIKRCVRPEHHFSVLIYVIHQPLSTLYFQLHSLSSI